MVAFFSNESNSDDGLRSVVYKHFLKSALLPFGSLISVMLVLYFWGSYFTFQTSLSEMRERAQSTVSEITRNEGESLNQKLQEIRRNTEYLRTLSEQLFKEAPGSSGNQSTVKLKRAENGAAYRDLSTIMDGSTIYGSSLPSSIYVASGTKLSDSLLQRLNVTEALDSHFQHTADSNPTINNVYFNSWDNTNRCYPPIANVLETFAPNTQLHSSKFYYMADEKHNPERKTIWTDAYLNSKTNNWLLSSITPIYHHGFLEGVVGVDIVLEDFTASLLSKSLIWDSIPFVVQNNGTVLGISEEGRGLLNLSLPTDDKKLTQATQMTENAKFSAQHNLFNHSLFTKPDAQGFISGAEQSVCCVWLDDGEYLLSQQTIAETGWRLVFLTPMNKVTQQVVEHLNFLKKMGIACILLTLVFFAALFVYLQKQATGLANRVSRPVEVVTDYISRLNKIGNNKPLPVMQVGICELDRLINSGTEIQLARRRLSQMNEELEQKNHQLQTLATTDRLTGLLNRHKLDEIIAYEFARARRQGNHFSLALLDVDHFKQVNDNHGHQVGDSILIGISAIMRRQVRRTDLVGRWGGEEFMIILPDTAPEQAASVLNHLREQFPRSNFEPVESITASIGLAYSRDYESTDCITEAADKALYRAKQNGRNRLEIEPEQKHQREPENQTELADAC